MIRIVKYERMFNYVVWSGFDQWKRFINIGRKGRYHCAIECTIGHYDDTFNDCKYSRIPKRNLPTPECFAIDMSVTREHTYMGGCMGVVLMNVYV